MLSEKDIQQALHAHRVVALPALQPHGPLGLEQLAAAVARLADSPVILPETVRIRRPILRCASSLHVATNFLPSPDSSGDSDCGGRSAHQSGAAAGGGA